jgi:hypothetical protein
MLSQFAPQIMEEVTATTVAASARFIRTTLLLSEGVNTQLFQLNQECLRMAPAAMYYFTITNYAASIGQQAPLSQRRRGLLQGPESAYTATQIADW